MANYVKNNGWNHYEVNAKAWQVYTWSGKTYVKVDFSGNFIETTENSKREDVQIKKLETLFPYIRNVCDAQGNILAKRKNMDSQLLPCVQRKNYQKRKQIS